MKCLWSLLLSVLLALPSTAQFDTLHQVVSRSFDTPQDMQVWQKEMRGTFDGRHEFDMLLFTDGEKYWGCYKKKGHMQIRLLEGSIIRGQIILYESDMDGVITGILEADINDYVFFGNWHNRKNQEECYFIAYENNYLSNKRLTDDWVKSYKSDSTYLTLHKVRDTGKLEIHSPNTYEVIELNCSDEDCIIQEAELLNNEGESENIRIIVGHTSCQIYKNGMTSTFVQKEHLWFKTTYLGPNDRKYYCIKPEWSDTKLLSRWDSHLQKILANQINDPYGLDVNIDYMDSLICSGTINLLPNEGNTIVSYGFVAHKKTNKVYNTHDWLTAQNIPKPDLAITSEAGVNFPFEDLILSLGPQKLIGRTPFHIYYGQTMASINGDFVTKRKKEKK